jgi:hypothetical protein
VQVLRQEAKNSVAARVSLTDRQKRPQKQCTAMEIRLSSARETSPRLLCSNISASLSLSLLCVKPYNQRSHGSFPCKAQRGQLRDLLFGGPRGSAPRTAARGSRREYFRIVE